MKVQSEQKVDIFGGDVESVRHVPQRELGYGGRTSSYRQVSVPCSRRNPIHFVFKSGTFPLIKPDISP